MRDQGVKVQQLLGWEMSPIIWVTFIISRILVSGVVMSGSDSAGTLVLVSGVVISGSDSAGTLVLVSGMVMSGSDSAGALVLVSGVVISGSDSAGTLVRGTTFIPSKITTIQYFKFKFFLVPVATGSDVWFS